MAKKKILIVDDEAGLTRMVKLNLEASGLFEVQIQNESLKAVETAKWFKPDLALLDVMMPEIDGAEVARQLRLEDAFKKLPIIFMTAAITTEELGASSGMLGGETFLAKPVDSKDLIRYIQMKLNG
jgi:DNA-binding response OmpR family regulator